MKIHPVGAELFHEDGRTDMTKPPVAFRSFSKAATKLETNIRIISKIPPKYLHINLTAKATVHIGNSIE
jgi:hypothetical protein